MNWLNNNSGSSLTAHLIKHGQCQVSQIGEIVWNFTIKLTLVIKQPVLIITCKHDVHHPQNWKCITYQNAAKGGPSHCHSNMHKNVAKIRCTVPEICLWTGKYTHHNTLLPYQRNSNNDDAVKNKFIHTYTWLVPGMLTHLQGDQVN